MSFININELATKETIAGYTARTIHTGNMTFVYWKVASGAESPLHQHPHEQVAHVLEGRFELTIGNETKILEPGMAAFVAGGVLHGGKALTECLLLDVFYPEREDYKF